MSVIFVAFCSETDISVTIFSSRISLLIMKKAMFIMGAFSLLFSVAVLEAASEFTKIKTPSAMDQCVLLGLEREVADVQGDIQDYYKELLDDPCKVEEGGDPRNIDCNLYRIVTPQEESPIPLMAEQESFWGRRTKYFNTQHAFIQWEKDKIASFRFVKKQLELGTVNLTKSTYIGKASIVPKTEPAFMLEECLNADPASRKSVSAPLDILIEEQFGGGRSKAYTMRFPSETDIEMEPTVVVQGGQKTIVQVPHVRDKTEEMDIDGKKMNVRILFIRDINERTAIVREYLRLLKLTFRRIDWNSRGADVRRAHEAERILKSR